MCDRRLHAGAFVHRVTLASVALSIAGCAVAPRQAERVDRSQPAAHAAVDELCDTADQASLRPPDWPRAFGAAFAAAARVRPDAPALATCAATAAATPAQAATRDWRSRQARALFDATGEDANALQGRAFRAFVNGLVATFGPRDAVIWPEDLARFTRSEVGVGLALREEGGGFEIADVELGSPADRAGIPPDSRLIAIDGAVPVSLTAAVAKLLGPTGEVVRLNVAVTGVAPREYAVARAAAPPRRTARGLVAAAAAADVVTLPGADGIAYVRIDRFTSATPAELDAALELCRRSSSRAIVLDLRNNAGGILTAVRDVIDRFVSVGPLFRSVDRSGVPRQSVPDAEQDLHDWLGPMVVLVDARTASGAELVAHVLRRRGRATLIGERTAGIDNVQMLFPAADRTIVLQLSTSRLIAADGTGFEGGLVPDVTVATADDRARWRAWRDYARLGRSGPDPLTFDPALRVAVSRLRS